ncbi:MAG TPA: hypothetical protein VFM21_01310 [Terriglobia bacterium]|nr:hypothetical protein [Terriglobia bacterium]
MRLPLARFAGFAALAALLAASGPARAQSSTPRGAGGAALTVQVGLMEANGNVAPPQDATVYILYGSLKPDPNAREENSDTAGGQFRLKYNQLLSGDRELKNLQKRTRKGHEGETADAEAALAMRDLEAALQATRNWLAQHPDLAWQLRTISPDRRGERTALELDPGPYEIVARGRIAQYDADWEATVSLRPEMTLTLPMTTPRFICRADK